jgi:hypothetical protein
MLTAISHYSGVVVRLPSGSHWRRLKRLCEFLETKQLSDGSRTEACLSLICELNQRLIYTWTEARHSGWVIRIYVDRLPGAEGESRVLAPSKVASCLLLGGCGGLRLHTRYCAPLWNSRGDPDEHLSRIGHRGGPSRCLPPNGSVWDFCNGRFFLNTGHCGVQISCYSIAK